MLSGEIEREALSSARGSNRSIDLCAELLAMAAVRSVQLSATTTSRASREQPPSASGGVRGNTAASSCAGTMMTRSGVARGIAFRRKRPKAHQHLNCEPQCQNREWRHDERDEQRHEETLSILARSANRHPAALASRKWTGCNLREFKGKFSVIESGRGAGSCGTKSVIRLCKSSRRRRGAAGDACQSPVRDSVVGAGAADDVRGGDSKLVDRAGRPRPARACDRPLGDVARTQGKAGRIRPGQTC